MSERDEMLDWVRGGSAFLVLAAHARAIVFPDFVDLVDPGPGVKVFYFLTGLHHEAVMVFFVLSGYFVGGSVLKPVAGGSFTWRVYALARLTRLWVVLVPALLLTVLCDRLGMQFAPEAYAGGFHKLWLSGPAPTSVGHYGVEALAGNLLFLQTIVTPVFGTNGPLWSLSYEFWYYVLFPLAVVGVVMARQRRWRNALFYTLIVAALVFWLPSDLLAKGRIWLMGSVVAMVIARRGRPILRASAGAVFSAVGAILFIGVLAATKFNPGRMMDDLVGGVFAIWMLVLPMRPKWLLLLEPVGKFLAGISYTLYVVHFPLLFLLGSVVLRGTQYDSVSSGAATYVGFLVLCLVVAALFWWLFESRTGRVRRSLMPLVKRVPHVDRQPDRCP